MTLNLVLELYYPAPFNSPRWGLVIHLLCILTCSAHFGTISASLGSLESFWRHFDVTLGWLWVYEGGLWSILGIKVVKERYMRVTLGSCWGHFGHMEVPLGRFGPLWGYFGATLSSLWGNLGVVSAYEGGFGRFWSRFGLTLSSLWPYS